MSSEANKLIKTASIKFTAQDEKKLKSLQNQINELHKEKRSNKKLFEETKGKFLQDLKNQRSNLKAQKENKIIVNIDNNKYNVKLSYLKSLKDPEKYLQGLNARKLRQYQQKAYKEKNYKAVQSLEKKLKSLNQKSGVSKYKLQKSKKEVNKIEEAFKKQGIKIPPKDKFIKKYAPIVTKSKEGAINITNI